MKKMCTEQEKIEECPPEFLTDYDMWSCAENDLMDISYWEMVLRQKEDQIPSDIFADNDLSYCFDHDVMGEFGLDKVIPDLASDFAQGSVDDFDLEMLLSDCGFLSGRSAKTDR